MTSRCWDPVLGHLRSPAVAVDLPGRRHRPADLSTLHLQDWQRALADDVARLGVEAVVLVGHSSGAYVLPGAAALLPAGLVRALVFVAGTCPRQGERPVDALAPKLAALTLANADRLRERATGRTIGDLRPGEAPIDTDLEIVEPATSMGVEAPGQLYDPVSWAGVPPVPRTYIRALRDRVIPPDHALVMAANAAADTVVDIDADHDVAASAPEELAGLLDRLVAEAVPARPAG